MISTPLINIFYDGNCGFCRRSMRILKRLDWLGHIEPVDFHDEARRLRIAPEIPYEELDRGMHVMFPDGNTLKGFSAFRRLCWHLPPLWIIAPFLYLPGVQFIGDRVYARIAKGRKRCTHDSCNA